VALFRWNLPVRTVPGFPLWNDPMHRWVIVHCE
jgi:hypothetical protein